MKIVIAIHIKLIKTTFFLLCSFSITYTASASYKNISDIDSTNLPLVVIDTKGQSIKDEPKVNIDLKIIHNGINNFNKPSDFGNVYNGIAGIEIRGSYSASLPQKPYGFETRDMHGENLNIPLLDMPKENDWILLANYNDKVFMRNLLAFHLFQKMGHYAPRAHLCEVVLNNEYEGIYILTEKIKRDKNRVAIAKLDADDNAGDSVTGGYIFKIDYPSSTSWTSEYENPNYPGKPVYIVPEYPKDDDFTTQQYNYLKNTVSEFEDVIWGSNFMDPETGYRKYINVESFIDYFIISELSRNMDGYKKSRRFYKDKDSKDPMIYAGPVWDFDWAFKDQGYDMYLGEGWQYCYTGASDIKPPGWYIRLLEDPWFANKLNCRYFEFRKSILNITYLIDFIDSTASLVNEAQARHYERWPILGVNVGTPEIGDQPNTYEGEVNKFKMWLFERINWLDENMPGQCIATDLNTITENKTDIQIFPNPSTDFININSEDEISGIRIIDATGKLVYQKNHCYTHQLTIGTNQWNGIYIIEIKLTNGEIQHRKLLTQ